MRIATLAMTALAGALLASPAFALTVETKMSAKFQEKLDDDIGTREARVLSDILTRKITKAFESQNVKAERVVVTIEDAKPNRPTMEQVSDKPGLDPMRSISIGGAKVSGIAYDAAGNELGRLDYRWYETDISNVYSSTVWTDARTSFDRFATRFAEKLS